MKDTKLINAVEIGILKSVKELFETGDYDINETYYNGITYLLIASNRGHVEVLKYLLENGADPTYEYGYFSLDGGKDFVSYAAKDVCDYLKRPEIQLNLLRKHPILFKSFKEKNLINESSIKELQYLFSADELNLF